MTQIRKIKSSKALSNNGLISFIYSFKPITSLGLSSALGALGRRFESYRPDSQKPSHTREFPKLSFFMSMSQIEKGAL